jgi:hypothetical protein
MGALHLAKQNAKSKEKFTSVEIELIKDAVRFYILNVKTDVEMINRLFSKLD